MIVNNWEKRGYISLSFLTVKGVASRNLSRAAKPSLAWRLRPATAASLRSETLARFLAVYVG